MVRPKEEIESELYQILLDTSHLALVEDRPYLPQRRGPSGFGGGMRLLLRPTVSFALARWCIRALSSRGLHESA